MSEFQFILLFNVLTAYPSGDEFSEGAGSTVIHLCVPLLSRVSLKFGLTNVTAGFYRNLPFPASRIEGTFKLHITLLVVLTFLLNICCKYFNQTKKEA